MRQVINRVMYLQVQVQCWYEKTDTWYAFVENGGMAIKQKIIIIYIKFYKPLKM